MSGFEIAGIVLAVLPCFTEAGKRNGAAIGNAMKKSKRNQELEEFYSTFQYETYEIQSHIKSVFLAIPNLSEDRKQLVAEGLRTRDLDSWNQDVDVAAALEEYMSPEDHAAFYKVLEKVLSLLARLVKDETVHISSSDKVRPRLGRKK